MQDVVRIRSFEQRPPESSSFIRPPPPSLSALILPSPTFQHLPHPCPHKEFGDLATSMPLPQDINATLACCHE